MTSVLSDSRFALIITFLAIAGMVLSGHIIGRIFPGMLVFFFLGLAGLVVLTVYGQSLYSTLSGAILLSVSFRAYSMYLPASVIGADTPGNVRWMQGVIETGSADGIGSAFYTDAPLHYLFGAISSLVLGVEPAAGIGVYAILISFFVPLITIVLARTIGVDNVSLLAIAAILALATTEVVRRTYWPVAQTHASIYWWLFLAVLIWQIKTPNKRFYGCLVLLTVVLALTHKLPLTLLFVLLLGLLLFSYLGVFSWGVVNKINPGRQILGLFLPVGVVMFIQWMYASALLGQIINRLTGFVTSLFYSSDSGDGSFEPEAAVEAPVGILAEIYPYPAEYALFWERAHGIWLLLFGGIGWGILFLYLKKSSNREAIQVLLLTAAICVSLIFVGFVSVGAMNPTRPLQLIEPILVVLIIGFIYLFQSRINGDYKKVYSVGLSVFIILLLVTQIFAASAAADYANTPRYYLDEPESHALEKMCEVSDKEIYLDQTYSQMTHCDQNNRISREPTDPLYNANISPNEHDVVMYRQNVDVYLGVQNRWILIWNPSQQLQEEYHIVYDNGNTMSFHS